MSLSKMVKADIDAVLRDLDRVLQASDSELLDAIAAGDYVRVQEIARSAEEVKSFQIEIHDLIAKWESIDVFDGGLAANHEAVTLSEVSGDRNGSQSAPVALATPYEDPTSATPANQNAVFQIQEIAPEDTAPLAGRSTVRAASTTHLSIVMKINYAEADGAFFSTHNVVVLAGSTITAHASESLREIDRVLRERLIQDGALELEPHHLYRLVRDQRFESLSAAARFVSGSSVNGRDYWYLATGQSVGEYLDEQDRANQARGR